MLRFVLLLLLGANVGYFAWSHGALAELGWAPHNPAESWRIDQQIQPQALALLGVPAAATPAPTPVPAAPAMPASPPPAVPAELAPTPAADTPAAPTAPTTPEPAPAPSPEPTAPPLAPPPTPPSDPTATAQTAAPAPAEAGLCLQAGPFDEDQTKAVRAALRAQEMPWESYELRAQEIAGRWMVYLGKFPNIEALAQRRAELREQKIDNDRAGGSLELGLSLGRFSTEEAATRELTRLLRQGVRGPRVVQERPASTVYYLRMPAVTHAQQIKIQAIAPALNGKPLRPCTNS